VRSWFATPRTPSVPNFSTGEGCQTPGGGPDAPEAAPRAASTWLVRRRSALRVLGRLAGLLEAVLLGLLLAGVAGEEAGLLEGGPQLGVELGEGPSDAEAQRTGLTGGAAAVDRGVDVVDAGRLGDPQRLGEDHLVGLRREVVLEGPLVDGDGAGAVGLGGTDPD